MFDEMTYQNLVLCALSKFIFSLYVFKNPNF